jgi:hypothetical protein
MFATDRGGIGHLGVALHENADLALVAHSLLCRGNRALPADRDRQNEPGKQHEAAYRNDDERIRRNWRHCLSGAAGDLVRGAVHVDISHARLPISAT